MATYETGHVKNVANLLNYNQFITTLGATYNPSMATITLSALTAMQATAKLKLDAVTALADVWKTATNNREIEFETLNSFSTQLQSILKTTDASQQTIDDFAFLINKMRGNSGNAAKKAAAKAAAKSAVPNAEEDAPKFISSSQQSFDQKIEHFGKMILILQGVTTYAPNEANMQIAALQAKLTNLQNLNISATKASADLKAARIDRNTFYYVANTGMLDTIKKSKNYIGGLYGKTSQQYKAAVAFKFIRVISKSDGR